MAVPHTSPEADAGSTQRLGPVLTRARERAGLTQEELSEMSGISVRAIRNLETGRTARPRRQSVLLLTRALGLPPAAHRHRTGTASHDAGARAADGGGALCELPPPPPLAGREAVLTSLTGHLTASGGGAAPGHPAVVVGPPGVGRTAVVTQVAHRAREAFPDGQVFVDLDAGGGEPLRPADVVHRVLRSLGVEWPPWRLEESTAQLRMLLHSRSVLIVLDNVALEAQVRPLLAHGGRSAVLAAARRELCALAPARTEPLGMLPPGDACRLLEDLVGRDRARAEPSATQSIARSCGGLPLALRIAGLWLAARPHRRLRELADLLVDEETRLDLLQLGDQSVRASVTAALHGLSEDERAVLAGLSSLRGWFGPADALTRLGRDRRAVIDVIEELQLRHLAEADGHGGQLRYRLHDAVRLYAARDGVSARPARPASGSRGLTLS